MIVLDFIIFLADLHEHLKSLVDQKFNLRSRIAQVMDDHVEEDFSVLEARLQII